MVNVIAMISNMKFGCPTFAKYFHLILKCLSTWECILYNNLTESLWASELAICLVHFWSHKFLTASLQYRTMLVNEIHDSKFAYHEWRHAVLCVLLGWLASRWHGLTMCTLNGTWCIVLFPYTYMHYINSFVIFHLGDCLLSLDLPNLCRAIWQGHNMALMCMYTSHMRTAPYLQVNIPYYCGDQFLPVIYYHSTDLA